MVVDGDAVDYSYLRDLIGHCLSLAYNRHLQMFGEVFDDLALSSKQFCALEFIARNPAVSQVELAQHIGTTPVTMVKLLDDLTKRGLLTRATDPANRRRHRISLTPTGRALLPKLKSRAYAVEQRVADAHGLSSAEQKQLLQLLRKIAGAPANTE